ncbi:hypothetical protein ACQEVG_32750 [Streptomyces sp. CA-135486]|uniref:hypothetical protein n=1 Tax=Streptomyces sp. CA-135486 TaxID=3240049 RepID=UPI003D9308C2
MSSEVNRLTPGSPVPVDPDTLPSLDLDDLAGESEAQLIARGAAYAREYARIEASPTILLKNIAAVVVALRVQYDDMLGKSHDYRQRVADMYRAAGIPPDSTARIQTAVRWHIGNLLRQRLTARQLRKLGLLETSPLERLQDNRATNAAIVAAATVSEAVKASTPKPAKGGSKGKDVEPADHAGAPVRATADHLRLAHVAGNILGQLDTSVVNEHMTDGQRAKLDEELAAIAKTITALRRHTRKPSSKR